MTVSARLVKCQFGNSLVSSLASLRLWYPKQLPRKQCLMATLLESLGYTRAKDGSFTARSRSQELDDRRNKNYGEWYNDSNPLSLDKIKWIVG
ncbi:MAG: hypothetical protein SAK29_08795 [Scytonema sp. PMC 1069.18]|nr:hypothetical protein [Scytonema sp. PMC 1069.18]MEC4884582.1 hypothetical protein [Scytonema sp. PMC 1070.18]